MTLDKLQTRRYIRQTKSSLILLLNISNYVKKMESILQSSSEDGELSKIERVAGEYNQLRFFLQQGQNLPLVDHMGPVWLQVVVSGSA